MPVKPKKAAQRFTAWSFSRYSTWSKCPFQAKCKFIDKLPEPPSPALDRGDKIHKLAEAFVKGPVRAPVPEELETFAAEFKVLRAKKAKTELQLAFTVNWEPCEWFAKDAWVRIVADALLRKTSTVLRIIDYKTGKMREESKDQLGLYAIAGFSEDPKLKQVHGELWYLDQGEDIILPFDRKQCDDLKTEWSDKVAPMMADTCFVPRPNNNCRWCAFSKAKGGPCKF